MGSTPKIVDYTSNNPQSQMINPPNFNSTMPIKFGNIMKGGPTTNTKSSKNVVQNENIVPSVITTELQVPASRALQRPTTLSAKHHELKKDQGSSQGFQSNKN